MGFNEAKQELFEGYSNIGLKLYKKTPKTISFIIRNHDLPLKISQRDISDYDSFLSEKSKYQIKPNECSIISTDYRESLIQVLSNSERFSSMNNPLRKGEIIFGDKEGTAIYVEVGEPSKLFQNFFRFNEYFCKFFQFPYLRIRRKVAGNAKELNFEDTIPRIFTIKIYNLNSASLEKAIDNSNQIIDSCLFTLSYVTNFPVTIADFWMKKEDTRHFDYKKEPYENTFPINFGVIDSDLVKLYNRSLSTKDPYIQYLSYYQVLERYFLDVLDLKVYSRLKLRLNTPGFQQNKKHLDLLINEVENYKQKSNETEMLKYVLQHFFEEDEIISFINDYEKFLGNKSLTKSGQIFGENLRIDLNKENLMSSLAKRIKTIRNCLIHSSDTYDRKDRYVPGKETDDFLKTEIPLMKYLAERIIISSYDFRI